MPNLYFGGSPSPIGVSLNGVSPNGGSPNMGSPIRVSPIGASPIRLPPNVGGPQCPCDFKGEIENA